MQSYKIKDEVQFIKKRFEIYRKLEDLVVSKGFLKVEPDYFEYYEQFILNNQRIKKESTVKIIKPNGSILLLRPDITTNIMKQVIPNWEKNQQLNLFYEASTFLQNDLKIIEQKQFGLESLGTQNDQNILMLLMQMFKLFGLDFKVEIGHQGFIDQLCAYFKCSINLKNKIKDLLSSKNTYEISLLKTSNSIDNRLSDVLLKLINHQGSMYDLSQNLLKTLDDKVFDKIFSNLIKLENTLKENDLSQYIDFDLSTLSHYDYYDGIVFKVYLQNESVPIALGGRYTPLTKSFGQEVPAIGFSILMEPFIKGVLSQ